MNADASTAYQTTMSTDGVGSAYSMLNESSSLIHKRFISHKYYGYWPGTLFHSYISFTS
jgi:hypothetical protein